MPYASSLRCIFLGAAISTLAGAGCSGGDEVTGSGLSGFTITQASQPTQTQATNETASGSDATASGTGEPTGTGPTTGEVTATTTDDPSDGTTLPDPTTTGVDPTTTGVDPSTTTDVDPSTTTTGVDPSTTTTGDDTTEGPMPPMKDPQPAMGMYEHCLMPEACDAPANVCLQLNDDNMQITDGYCTVICKAVADCGPKPNAPATQECFSISAMDKICGLKCAVPTDCPTGMVCTNLALPNMQQGMYCI